MRITNCVVSVVRSDTGWKVAVNGNKVFPAYGPCFKTKEEAMDAAQYAASKIYA